MTNREYIIGLLDDEYFVDDDGASYEAMVYYNIACPYRDGDKRCKCRGVADITRDMCFECKEEWLNSEVDE